MRARASHSYGAPLLAIQPQQSVRAIEVPTAIRAFHPGGDGGSVAQRILLSKPLNLQPIWMTAERAVGEASRPTLQQPLVQWDNS
jgi:hypothetical protein